MKRDHSFWVTYREASEVVDLGGLNDYWSSNNHEFTVLSQSLSPGRKSVLCTYCSQIY